MCPWIWQLPRKIRKRGWTAGHYLLEGLFSSVRPDVVVERRGPSKRTTTVATLERPVTGVSDHVVPQFWWLGKGLGAVATLVGSETNREWLAMVSCVNPQGEERGCHFRSTLFKDGVYSAGLWVLLLAVPGTRFTELMRQINLTNEHSLPVWIILFQKQLFAISMYLPANTSIFLWASQTRAWD